MTKINITEAMRQFAAGNAETYDRLAYIGNALQMAAFFCGPSRRK